MSIPMNRKPDPGDYAPYFAQYINQIPDGDVLDILTTQRQETMALLSPVSEKQGLYRYERGKWSLKEVLGHIIDTERIFAYRALRIARNDQTPLPGFEQDDYVAAGEFDLQPWSSLLHSYEQVRVVTLDLFSSLSPVAWQRRGTVNQEAVTVQALAWIICGHEQHHLNVIRMKYLA